MPIRKSDYHPDWSRISLEVREAAAWQCEWCGASNKKVIRRHKKVEKKMLHLGCSKEKREYNVDWELVISMPGTECYGPELTCDMTWKRLKFHGLTRIIITVAHLDRDTKNNEKENLAALCQRCHLRHDIHQHIRNRNYGRYHDREHQLKFDYETENRNRSIKKGS